MIAEVDESGARAIVEHAKSLSGVIETGSPKGGAVVAAPAQFPAESGHWYDPATGKQVELPPRTWTKTYIARGYVPGVTTINRQEYKEAIARHDEKEAILAAAEVLRQYNDPEIPMQDDCLVREARALKKAKKDAIFGRGKEFHAAIELAAQGAPFLPLKWIKHVEAVADECEARGITLATGNTEHSFATLRYGGKIDWHNDEWLLDFKTKPSIIEGKRLAYPEHAQQLAAYAYGICGLDIHTYGPLESKRQPMSRRCANVFIGVEDTRVVFHEWKEKDLLQGWREFDALCSYWWIKNGVSK